MKAKQIFPFLLFLFSMHITAQERIYFDSAWAVTSKDKMVFYRESTKEKNLTHIKDFYNNGVLQMEAFSTNPVVNEEVYEGEAKWFYPNGKLQSVSNYKNGVYSGVSKSYDENARLVSDLVYGKEDSFDGKIYSFATKDDDYSSNSVTEYKNSNVVKSIEFDKDVTKLRKETIYGKDYGPSETKYYDENGKMLGSGSTDEEGNVKGISIDYFSNPMRISHYTKYGKDNTIAEEKAYYKNGKLKFEYTGNKKSATKKFYDVTGKSLGSLISKEVEKDYGMTPYQGNDVYFFDESESVERISTYVDGKVIQEKSFFPSGKLDSETNYGKDEGEITDRITYEEDGTKQYRIKYQDGSAYNGTEKNYNQISEYKGGVLNNQKVLNDAGKVIYEKSINNATQKYDHIVYDKVLKKKLSFSTKIEDQYELLNTEISYYKNGKIAQKAIVDSGILKSGIIMLEDDYGSSTYERKGDYLIMKQFDAGNLLIKESKTFIKKINDSYYDYDLKTFTESDFVGDPDMNYPDY